MEQSEYTSLDRLTVATAVDFLRDYRTEFLNSDSTGEYTREMSETIETLEDALEET